MQTQIAFGDRTRPPRPDVHLEVLPGRALVDGVEAVLCPPQRLLLCALVRCRHGITRDALQGLVWPDDHPARAENLLNIAIHRLRKRIGEGAIVQSAHGYRLGDHVVVDLWELESLAARVRSGLEAELANADRWIAVARRVCCGCSRSAADPEFVATLERRMQSAVRDVTDRLARRALAQRQPELALELARVIRAFDECDESACELAIRAHLALGDRSAAIREYRDYSRALAQDLGLEPAFTLVSLVA